MNKNLYRQALEKWGEAKQLDMAVEECAELVFAIQKLKRKFDTVSHDEHQRLISNVIEEMVDVYIMIGQLETLFDREKQFKTMLQLKLDRLRKRLKK